MTVSNSEMLEAMISSCVNREFRDSTPSQQEFNEIADNLRKALALLFPVTDDEYQVLKQRLAANIVNWRRQDETDISQVADPGTDRAWVNYDCHYTCGHTCSIAFWIAPWESPDGMIARHEAGPCQECVESGDLASWELIEDEPAEDGGGYSTYCITHICGHITTASYFAWNGTRHAALDERADQDSMHVCEACQ